MDDKDRFENTILEKVKFKEYRKVGKKKIPKVTTSLTEDQVREIIAQVRSGRSQTSVALEFGVGQPLVCLIMQGKRWGHLLEDPEDS